MKSFITILFLCIILAAGCISSSPSEEDVAHTTPVPLSPGDAATLQNLDDYMTALADAGRFTGAVLVARDGTVLLSTGYGMANREFSVPNTPETVFPIDSNTKQFTAAAVMKLQEEGRLNITDPIS